jgi:hypothetical protein
VSIRIFTSQLRKARLATNQANARAAYAAATAALLDSTATDSQGNYTYTVSTATVGPRAEYAAISGGDSAKAVAEWTVESTLGSGTTKLGDQTAKTFTVAISKDGAVSFDAGF